MPQVLFSRYEHGAQPVTVLPDGWELGGVQFSTTKGLLGALTGHPRQSFDRYFQLGKYGGPTPLGVGNVFELFPLTPPNAPLLVTTPGISIPRETPLALGIDLRKRANEVRKLLFAGFGRRIFMSGYDPEDVLQEVYKGILIRNEGTCPWDARKSSFGHYVHMVIGCVLSNYHRKQHRVHEMEQLGMLNPLGGDEGVGRHTDVAACMTLPAKPSLEQEDALLHEVAEDLTGFVLGTQDAESRLAAKVLPHILKGTPRDEMTIALGVSNASISRAISHLRRQALAWSSTSVSH